MFLSANRCPPPDQVQGQALPGHARRCGATLLPNLATIRNTDPSDVREKSAREELMTVNRRDVLLKGGAVAALAAGTSAPQPAAAQTAIQWHKEADVVVIGSGACGLPAAIVARETGSSV